MEKLSDIIWYSMEKLSDVMVQYGEMILHSGTLGEII